MRTLWNDFKRENSMLYLFTNTFIIIFFIALLAPLRVLTGNAVAEIVFAMILAVPLGILMHMGVIAFRKRL